MITIGSLPVRTRLPVTAWVLAGLVTLFSLIQANVEWGGSTRLAAQTTGPSKASCYAGMIGLWVRRQVCLGAFSTRLASVCV